MKLGYHPHTLFSHLVHFFTRLCFTVTQVAEWKTDLAFLGSDNGSLLGAPFLAKDSEVRWFALGKMPVSLLPILLFAQNGTVLLVGGEFQDLASPVVRPSTCFHRRWNLALWGNVQKQARSLGGCDSKSPSCAEVSDLFSSPAGLVFVEW